MDDMADIKGAQLVAKCLQEQGIREVFGLVGYPVTEIGFRIQAMGLRYIGTRHEQAAGFAAQAAAYLRGHVGVALTVSGPGMTNAITAMGNAWSNCWPLLVISGSADQPLEHRGAFQDAPQIEAARPFCKWVGRARRVEDIPRLIAEAIRHAWHGRPGPVYLDIPADVIDGMTDEDALHMPPRVQPPPRVGADPALIEQALRVLRGAKRPLAIVGKGAAWADAAPEVRRFIAATGIPFLPSPMGKGVVPDNDPHSVAAARAFALREADTVVLFGARLNWIMHFGLPPRYRPDLKVIQIDLAPEELGRNVPATVGIAGDLKAVMAQLVAGLEQNPWQCPPRGAWRKQLADNLREKRAQIEPMLQDGAVPMGYYRPLQEIQNALPPDAILVSEGSNTMDISRSVIENIHPKHRLDAGTWGTMGVGPGFALAAAVVHPEKRVLALLGDGAFGFDGMEVEVSVRYNLPITWVVFVNGGIGGGVANPPKNAPPPVHTYTPHARYDRIIEAFGGKGYHCETPDELARALKAALAAKAPSLINVAINPEARRAPQPFGWLSR